MVLSNKKQFAYVLAVAIGAKAEEGALQTTVGVKVNANGDGVEKVGGPVYRRLMDEKDEDGGRYDHTNFGNADAMNPDTFYDYFFEAVDADTKKEEADQVVNEAFGKTAALVEEACEKAGAFYNDDPSAENKTSFITALEQCLVAYESLAESYRTHPCPETKTMFNDAEMKTLEETINVLKNPTLRFRN